MLARASTSQAADLAGYAERLGLARPAFPEAMAGDLTRQTLDRDAAEARRRDVRGTPTFFVNQGPGRRAGRTDGARSRS
jgi:predicted DsbA family dithiol-disulfide isomerase